MIRSFALIIFVATTLRANVVDLAPQQGRVIPSISWMDDAGRAWQLSEFSGYPVILLPIYTRCPGPCLQNVDRLKEALADSANNPRQFRVLLFSFDASDNVMTLKKYRERENIPLNWSIGAASQKNIDALLEASGVQVGKAGMEFIHPNIVVFLDPKLRIAKWIYGTTYSGRDVDHALQIANGETDWIGQHAQLLYSLLLFAGSGLCVAFAYYVMQFIALRRSGRDNPSIHPISADR